MLHRPFEHEYHDDLAEKSLEKRLNNENMKRYSCHHLTHLLVAKVTSPFSATDETSPFSAKDETSPFSAKDETSPFGVKG
jgi:hypothetical protein